MDSDAIQDTLVCPRGRKVGAERTRGFTGDPMELESWGGTGSGLVREDDQETGSDGGRKEYGPVPSSVGNGSPSLLTTNIACHVPTVQHRTQYPHRKRRWKRFAQSRSDPRGSPFPGGVTPGVVRRTKSSPTDDEGPTHPNSVEERRGVEKVDNLPIRPWVWYASSFGRTSSRVSCGIPQVYPFLV